MAKNAAKKSASRRKQPNILVIWGERLRLPKLYNLRTDPFEYAHTTSNEYWSWLMSRAALVLAAQALAAKFAETFKEFPAVQKPNTFTVDDALAKMSEVASGG